MLVCPRKETILKNGRQRRTVFGVKPDDLLAMGKDPCFCCRGTARIGQQIPSIYTTRTESFSEALGLDVVAYHASEQDLATETLDIDCNISRTPWNMCP